MPGFNSRSLATVALYTMLMDASVSPAALGYWNGKPKKGLAMSREGWAGPPVAIVGWPPCHSLRANKKQAGSQEG